MDKNIFLNFGSSSNKARTVIFAVYNFLAVFYGLKKYSAKFVYKIIALFVFLPLITSCSGSKSGALRSVIGQHDALTLTPVTKTIALGSTVQFKASGGSGTYSFDIYFGNGTLTSSGDTGTYQAPVAQGTSVIRVQDTDGGIGYATLEISDVPVIQPSSKALAINNKFPFSAVGGKSPYTFSVVSGGGTINVTTGEFTAGTTAGAVVIRVTDAGGRTADANITINGSLTFTNKNVYVEKGSTTTLVASSGVPPYKFSLASGLGSVDESTGVFTASNTLGVSAVYVFDSVGNVDLATVNTTSTLAISPSNILLSKNGTFVFTAIGGVPPYAYSVQSGSGTIGSITGLYVAPNFTSTETVRVTDSLGSTSDSTVTVTNNLSFSVANIILAVGNTLDVSTVVSGGTAPLTYTATSSNGTFAGSQYTAPNTPGLYSITVYDSASPTPNSVTTSVLVNPALNLLPASSAVAVSAQKSFSASGGVPPYTYSVQSGGGTVSTTGLYTAPSSSGNAVLLVTDARGNTATATVTVQDALNISPLTKTLSSGEGFTFTASGGSTPYTFSLVSGAGSINSSSGLYTAPGSAGMATVRVEDALGNRKDALITILNPLYISPPAISLAKNSSITFTASGGAAPYTFSVASGDGTVNSSTGAFVAPSAAGTSTVRVTDSLGSTVDATVTIYNGLSISPFTKTLAVNQTFTFTASGGVSPYTYSVTTGVGTVSSAGSYSSSTAGNAVVRVTDSKGNTSDASVSVNSALTITPTTKTLGVSNSFTFNATGGVPPYSYAVASGGGTITATGDYKAPATNTTAVVRVTDSASSTADATVTVNDPLTISPLNSTVAAGGTQTFIAAGGVGPYTYTVVSGGGSFASAVFTAPSVATGASVSILVTDTLGNTANASVTVNPITVTISSPNSSDVITASNKAAFPVSGTCTESGRTVQVSATGGVTAMPSCSGGAWSTTLNLSSVADGNVTITANHSNVNSVAAAQASVTLSKDGSNPTISITTPAANAYVNNSVTVTGSCTKTGPVNVSVTGGVTGVASCDGSSYSSTLNITPSPEGAITISVSHTDSSGNTSTTATVNVTKDSVAPVISAFAVTNSSPTNSTTYNLTSSITEANSISYYCIQENSTVVANCSWQSGSLPSSFVVNGTNNAKVLTAWVKDIAGNISAAANSNSVTLDTVVPDAPTSLTLSSPASSPGTSTTPAILVSGVVVGDSVKIYTDSACQNVNLKGTATVGSGTTVTVSSSALSAGSYTFYARRTTSIGNTSNCSTASVAYVLDLTAPTISDVTASGNGPYKAGDSFTVSIVFSKIVNVTGTPVLALDTTRVGAQASYSSGSGTNTLVFSYAVVATDTSSDLTYTATNSLTLNSGTIKDAAGNNATLTLPTIGAAHSLSYNQSIVLDTTAPVAPSSIVDGVWSNSTTASPTITFTAGTDVGGTGILKHQIQVVLGSNTSTVVKAWADFTSGSTVTGLSLSDGTQYKVQIKAIDNVGNESSVATSDGWTVDTTLPSVPTSPARDLSTSSLNSSPVLSWTASSDSGSGVSYYQVQIYKQADNTTVGSAVTLASGNAVTGLSLTDGVQYYFKVRAIDTAGNIGNESVASSAWTAMLCALAGQSVTYNTSGSFSFTPACSAFTVKMWGGGGGGGGGGSTYNGQNGGGGGYATATISGVSTSQNFTIIVGGGGGAGALSTDGGGGGGRSALVLSGSDILTAGGGGGGGGGDGWSWDNHTNPGGAGGGTSGLGGGTPTATDSGAGGTQVAGGAGATSATYGANPATSGTLGAGGNANYGNAYPLSNNGGSGGGGSGSPGQGFGGSSAGGGGGGGGGYYGGGGGAWGKMGTAGGGGSSYITGGGGYNFTNASTIAGSSSTPGGNSVSGWAGNAGTGGTAGSGNAGGTAGVAGLVIITY
ncbi:MAG: beta strand repeat-containing protein [Pseudobdellovibrionaceae bacterium]